MLANSIIAQLIWPQLLVKIRGRQIFYVSVFVLLVAVHGLVAFEFSEHSVNKKYLLLTDREISFQNRVVKSTLVRAGEKYVSRPLHAGGEKAETHFARHHILTIAEGIVHVAVAGASIALLARRRGIWLTALALTAIGMVRAAVLGESARAFGAAGSVQRRDLGLCGPTSGMGRAEEALPVRPVRQPR